MSYIQIQTCIQSVVKILTCRSRTGLEVRRSIDGVLNARCEAIEARMDSRVADIKGEVRALLVRLDERDVRHDEMIMDFNRDSAETRKQISNLKYIVVTTGIASVIGLYAANVATMQALLSAYDSGKATATVFAQAAERIQRTNERLDVMEDRLNQKINNIAYP
jgi:hypothetical protein